MASELKDLHPYLYKRVRLKFVVFTLLGLSLVFSEWVDKIAAHRGTSSIPNLIAGIVFLIIGAGIGYGLFKSAHIYRVSRLFLRAAFIYALYWEIILILTTIYHHASTASLVILWGYLTYNLYIIQDDTGWQGAAILKRIQDGEKPDGSK